MDTTTDGVIDDNNVALSSSCAPAVVSNMARENLGSDSSAKDHSPESYFTSNNTFESFIPGNHVPVDDAPAHLGPAHEAPGHQAPGSQSPEACIVNDHKIGKDTPELYIALGDVHEQGKPDTYIGVDDVGGQDTAGDSFLRPITIPGKLSLSKSLILCAKTPKLTPSQTLPQTGSFPRTMLLRTQSLRIRCANSCNSPPKSV